MKSIKEIYNLLNSYQNSKWYSQLELVKEKNLLNELQEEVENFVPKIAVIGEFSTGKSTLINSFLAEDLLPSEYIPTTAFITYLNYSKENYLLVDGERIELTKNNLKNIGDVHNDKIDIFLNNPILKNFTIVDTPGTNDPSKFTDDIVFKLVGESDIVIFMMNINQALKETEKTFISKLIKEKELDKFFFILNWADTVDNPRIVKNEVMEKLTALLSLDKDLLKQHTFLYSAKEVLNARMQHKENNNFEILLENINNYIENNRKTLLKSWANQELEKIIGSILFKIDTLADKIKGNSKKYESDLEKINNDIKSFEYEISKELLALEKDFVKIKENYKKSIKDSIKSIINDISEEVNKSDFEQLTNSRYIELRTKKLLEDRVEETTRYFMEDISKLINTFDKKIIETKGISRSFAINSVQKATTAKKVVNVTALMAAGAGAVSVAPMAGGVLAAFSGVAGFGAIAPLLTAIPVVGPVLGGLGAATAVALPVVGTFAVAAGKVLFDVGKWGLGKIGDLAKAAEEKAKKMRYIRTIEKSLSDIEKTILKNIDGINLDKFKDEYIKSKFPEKGILEEKINFISNKQIEADKLAQKEVQELEKFKTLLIDSLSI